MARALAELPQWVPPYPYPEVEPLPTLESQGKGPAPGDIREMGASAKNSGIDCDREREEPGSVPRGPLPPTHR